MRDSYSLHETKAKLSAIIRQVREGRSVIVTVRGEPVAAISYLTLDERQGDVARALGFGG